jgi:hypothetical protein
VWGASLKNWECRTPILPKGMAHSSNFPKKTKKKNPQKRAIVWRIHVPARGRRAIASHRLAAAKCPELILCKRIFFPPTLNFLHMWSTLASWLQHMPALPKLLLKTSNIHNFWAVGPKMMNFVLTQSVLRGTSSQKSFQKK